MASTFAPRAQINGQTVLLSILPGVATALLCTLLAPGDELQTALFILIGFSASAIVLWFRLQTAHTDDLSSFAKALEQEDLQGAIREARSMHLGVDAMSVLIRLLSEENSHPEQSEPSPALNEVRGHIEVVSNSMRVHVESVSRLDRAMRDEASAQGQIGSNVEGLSQSALATSSSVMEMVAINNEVTENMHNLSVSVQETTTAIEEMTFSVKEVAKNIEELSTAAEETAASMNEMDVSISQVETNANETSKLSETVTSDAETGVSAINKTINGIDRIKESSRIASEVIGNLGAKIDEIGNILTVIDDVAEQTNLLALNAAIIAAQAGEHGRGFAVVADEIKALAERTGSSTKEIAELIKTVQNESRNAISVMSQGVDDVQQGVQLGHNAEDALRKIVDSAKRSTLMIKAIAQATVEQSKGSKQVTNAISRIAETVQQIALATAEQAKGAEQIMKSAERMKVITSQVERSTEEQNRGGRQMTDSIENIRELVESMNNVQRERQNLQDRIAEAAEKADSAGQTSIVAIQNLQSLIESKISST